jgi:hypothetical protein
MTTGANEDGFHLRHVDVERDIKVDVWKDLRTVRAGEAVRDHRRAAEDPARHRGRARLQAGYQVQREAGVASFLDADGSAQALRSWAATASG